MRPEQPGEAPTSLESTNVAMPAASQGAGFPARRPSEGSWLPLLGGVGIVATVLVAVTIASIGGDRDAAVSPGVTPSATPSAVQGLNPHGGH